MLSTRFLVVAAFIAIIPAAVGAQTLNDRVAKSLPKRYVGATCEIKTGHYLISSTMLYLKTGTEQGDPEKRVNAFNSGVRVSHQAITESGQADNPMAWYILGRLYLHLGDLTGADSAFTRAEKLAPECAEDIKAWRQRAFLPLMNPGTEFFRTGNNDSALVLFREAAMIAPDFPQSFYNAGVLFANSGETDSAIVYLKRAKEVAAADAAQFGKDRNAATFNLAALLQRADRHAEAAAELTDYLSWDPSDVDAKRALAQSLRVLGRNQEASKIDQELLATAEAAGTLTSGDLMGMGVTFFNDKKFAEAAEAFEKVLVKEPYNRDALFNLANTYFALDNGGQLIATATKLVAMDPLNEDSRKLVSQGYRILNDKEKLLEAVTRLVEMPTTVELSNFSVSATGASIEGVATGRQAQTLEGKEVPANAKTLAFDFLNIEGEVVATGEVSIPALQAATKHPFTLAAEGAGIVAWRYTVK